MRDFARLCSERTALTKTLGTSCHVPSGFVLVRTRIVNIVRIKEHVVLVRETSSSDRSHRSPLTDDDAAANTNVCRRDARRGTTRGWLLHATTGEGEGEEAAAAAASHEQNMAEKCRHLDQIENGRKGTNKD